MRGGWVERDPVDERLEARPRRGAPGDAPAVADAAAVPAPGRGGHRRPGAADGVPARRARARAASASTRASSARTPPRSNRAAVAYLVVAVLGLVFGRWVIWLVSRTGERFLRALREQVFRHIMSLSMDFFEREKTGRLVSRMTSDIDALQELIRTGS